LSELARGVGERGVHLPSLGRSRPLSRTSFSGGQNNLKFTRRLHQPFGRTELSVAGQSFLPGNPCSCPCREGNQKGTLTSTEQQRPNRHDYICTHYVEPAAAVQAPEVATKPDPPTRQPPTGRPQQQANDARKQADASPSRQSLSEHRENRHTCGTKPLHLTNTREAVLRSAVLHHATDVVQT
jgi:hypothetical protein